MLEFTKGSFVPLGEKISEQYEVDGSNLIANVDASKIEEVLQHFICIQESPLFFILELPANRKDEDKLRQKDTDPMHKDIYCIDGLTDEQALVLLMRYGELLIHDGVSKFGFGAHDGSSEIMRDKYNVVTIWAKTPDDYIGFFEEHNIPRVEHCFTAWETFSEATPGESSRVDVGELSVFDLPNELKDWGIYFHDQREDD